MKPLLAELKRRNVYKVAAAYAVVGWLVIQISSTVLPTFHAPEWVTQTLVLLVLLGLPVALVLAWAFEMTPAGLKRTEDVSPTEVIPQWSTRKFVMLIAAIAVCAAGLLAYQVSQRSRVQAVPLDKSIAVLPFKSLSDDKANNYFADGIQDEILTRLSKLAELKVISRTSTQKYQSSPDNLREIAQQLGVTNILEGSVQKAGESVRITVQLINAVTDAHLWAETYDRKLTDIFGVESEVAQRIAAAMEARLSGHEKEQLAVVPTKNSEAYDAYLRAIALLNRQSPEDVTAARDLLQRAVELDPSYAQAWAQLAIAESQLYSYSAPRTAAQIERARHAADTAIQLQPELAETRTALATFYYFCLKDYDRALGELAEAQKRSPNNAAVTLYTALVKRRQGKLDETIEFLTKAAAGDPRNPDIWYNLGGSYRGVRNLKLAREMFERAHAISPDELQMIAEVAETHLAEGNLNSAESLLRGRQSEANEAFWQSMTCLIYRREFLKAAQAISDKAAETKGRPPVFYANVKGYIGELTVGGGDSAKGRPLVEQSRRELAAIRDAGDNSLLLLDQLLEDNAVLGDRAGVEREATRLLQQSERDHWRTPTSQENIARSYAILGDADKTIPIITNLLSVPYRHSLTSALLRLDPVWDKIRNDPRFQKLASGSP